MNDINNEYDNIVKGFTGITKKHLMVTKSANEGIDINELFEKVLMTGYDESANVQLVNRIRKSSKIEFVNINLQNKNNSEIIDNYNRCNDKVHIETFLKQATDIIINYCEEIDIFLHTNNTSDVLFINNNMSDKEIEILNSKFVNIEGIKYVNYMLYSNIYKGWVEKYMKKDINVLTHRYIEHFSRSFKIGVVNISKVNKPKEIIKIDRDKISYKDVFDILLQNQIIFSTNKLIDDLDKEKIKDMIKELKDNQGMCSQSRTYIKSLINKLEYILSKDGLQEKKIHEFLNKNIKKDFTDIEFINYLNDVDVKHIFQNAKIDTFIKDLCKQLKVLGEPIVLRNVTRIVKKQFVKEKSDIILKVNINERSIENFLKFSKIDYIKNIATQKDDVVKEKKNTKTTMYQMYMSTYSDISLPNVKEFCKNNNIQDYLNLYKSFIYLSKKNTPKPQNNVPVASNKDEMIKDLTEKRKRREGLNLDDIKIIKKS